MHQQILSILPQSCSWIRKWKVPNLHKCKRLTANSADVMLLCSPSWRIFADGVPATCFPPPSALLKHKTKTFRNAQSKIVFDRWLHLRCSGFGASVDTGANPESRPAEPQYPLNTKWPLLTALYKFTARPAFTQAVSKNELVDVHILVSVRCCCCWIAVNGFWYYFIHH